MTPEGSLIGHPAVPSVVAVGAINVSSPGHDTVEAYSSQGPVDIRFPAPELRLKPDLSAFDGVTTSAAGLHVVFRHVGRRPRFGGGRRAASPEERLPDAGRRPATPRLDGGRHRRTGLRHHLGRRPSRRARRHRSDAAAVVRRRQCLHRRSLPSGPRMCPYRPGWRGRPHVPVRCGSQARHLRRAAPVAGGAAASNLPHRRPCDRRQRPARAVSRQAPRLPAEPDVTSGARDCGERHYRRHLQRSASGAPVHEPYPGGVGAHRALTVGDGPSGPMLHAIFPSLASAERAAQ